MKKAKKITLSAPLRNKVKALMQELVALGVAIVEIEFSGSGDDGCCSEPSFYNELKKPCAVSIDLSRRAYDLGDEVLEQIHDGWEDGDGGHGTVTLLPKSVAITMNCPIIEYEELNSEASL